MTDVETVEVPGQARELAALKRVDYADCFSVAVSEHHTPEEWIRTAVAAMPALFTAVRGAHRALGLRLAPADSHEHVIGWNVVCSGADQAVLGNSGWLGSARIVGLTSPGRVVLATLIEFNGSVGRALWTIAAPVHRAVARHILGELPTLAPRQLLD
jgi:hypothetical protein